MKINSFVLIIFFLIFFPIKGEGENLREDLTILYTNSTNGYLISCDCKSNPFGGVVRRATLVKDIRSKKNILLLDSGDFFPPEPDRLKIDYLVKAIKYLDYDAIAIGDQELILGWEFLKNLIDREKLPFMSSNLVVCSENLCLPISSSYIVKEVGGWKVAIFGIIDEKSILFLPKNLTRKLKIRRPLPLLKRLVSKISKEVDLIILLSHGGLEFDKKLAKEIENIDLICGGHSQNLIKEPLRIKDTIIVQAGEKGQYLGYLSLNRDKKGRIVIRESKLIPLKKKIKDDPIIKKLIEELREKREEKLKTLLFNSKDNLKNLK